MAPRSLPEIQRLTLAVVTAVPEWHPEHGAFEPFPVHAWVIDHPDGAVLVDAGIGLGNALIDEWYQPQVTPLAEALDAIGLAPADIAAIVVSHLHFDHCGQLGALTAPVYVQADEHAAAQAAGYTVPEWAAISADRLRLVDGDAEVADGIHVLATPGHTPGHQSVLIESGDERVVLAAQCAFRAPELRAGLPTAANLHDDTWEPAARASLARLHALAPITVHLSHDDATVHLAGSAAG